VRSRNHEAPRCAIFTKILVLPLRPEHLPILRFPICDTNANSYINSGRKSVIYLKGIFSTYYLLLLSFHLYFTTKSVNIISKQAVTTASSAED
jgi:hypothetical protein